MDIRIELNSYNEYFNRELSNLMESFKPYFPKDIYEPMYYILFTGGKRIRPFILNRSYKIFRDDMENSLPFEIALEMIHTYSLVHDDLPSMDDDDYRRGKETVHKKYGEASGVLTGDALLNMSMEVITSFAKDLDSDIQRKYFKGMNQLYKSAGASGMIGGQILDISYENKDQVSLEELLKMYELKTSELFQSASKIGTILASDKEEDIKNMEDFGKYLGIAYQLQDDFLDYEEDLAAKKPTVACLKGKDFTSKLVDEYSEKANESLLKLNNKNIGSLQNLIELLVGRKYWMYNYTVL